MPQTRDESTEAANPAMLRRLNARLAFQAIEQGHPITRADIARATGMAKPTAAAALALLLQAGLVKRVAQAPANAHYAAVFFEPAPEVASVLGVDIADGVLRAALADLGGTVLARHDVPLRAPEDLAAGLSRLRRALTAEPSWPQVTAGVVGAPGLVDQSGDRLWETSVEQWEDLPLAVFGDNLGLPVVVENDVNLAALGEQWRGAGRDVSDFVFLLVSTGVGAGLVLSGSLHRGAHGAAGEVDYPRGRREGRSGTASAVGLLATARRRLARWEGPTMLREPLETGGIFAAFRAGDPLADQIIWELARRIARTLAPISQVADVALAVLGGEIGVAVPGLADRVAQRLQRDLPRAPEVVISELQDEAVLTGALSVAVRLGRERVLTERLSTIAG
jgi:predicted NBD/HSP70 family sugar kinase